MAHNKNSFKNSTAGKNSVKNAVAVADGNNLVADGNNAQASEPVLEAMTDATATVKRAPDASAHASQVTTPEKALAKRKSKKPQSPPDPNYPRYRVEPGAVIKLSGFDPEECEHYKKKEDVAEALEVQRKRISDLQTRLYAERRQALLIVLQAMDTGGKDGTIRGVFQGVNPQGCEVASFKAPSAEEIEHDFLWRYHRRTPVRGMITIFNRSHYEDVLIVRVKNIVMKDVWQRRYDTINEFEHVLTLNNTTVLKFFLYISRDEQKRRLESRLADPNKHWKFSTNDIKERAFWDQYMLAFEDSINNCSTDYASWYVVPSNKKWYRNLVIARTIADTLEAMNPRFPSPEPGLENIRIPD